jgi:single-strand selective monofunctional uracil DNA glycosylase
VVTALVQIAEELRDAVSGLAFSAPVTHVYNPLQYAWAPHRDYLQRWGRGRKEAVLVGMNPGPWGMAQTGVPFGEVSLVRDWIGVRGQVDRPELEHPKRPVTGFSCGRSEVSGARLWGWARSRFERPEHFFERFFVLNFCPLVFMEASGRNRTPDKLPAAEQKALLRPCREALRRALAELSPRFAIGVGAYAEGQLARTPMPDGCEVGRILHPSPASPLANKDWAGSAERQLRSLGLKLP